MTVGFGIAPNQLTPVKDGALAGLQKDLLTAGGEFRPALRTLQPLLATFKFLMRLSLGDNVYV